MREKMQNNEVNEMRKVINKNKMKIEIYYFLI